MVNSPAVLALVVMLILSSGCSLTTPNDLMQREQSITPIIKIEYDNEKVRDEVREWFDFVHEIEARYGTR